MAKIDETTLEAAAQKFPFVRSKAGREAIAAYLESYASPYGLIAELEARRNDIIGQISPYQVDYAVNKAKAKTLQEVIALIKGADK